MSNVGHTFVEATGPAPDLAALLAHVQSTARDGVAFTLSSLMGVDRAPDPLVDWADLKATPERVSLSVGIHHDLDCLGVAECLARRFPTLRVTGDFQAEGDASAFKATCLTDGALADAARFEDDIACTVPSGQGDDRYWLFRFFERSAAALDQLDPINLAEIAQQLAVTGGWRRLTCDRMAPDVYWHPGTADSPGQVLAMHADEFTVLHEVDVQV